MAPHTKYRLPNGNNQYARLFEIKVGT